MKELPVINSKRQFHESNIETSEENAASQTSDFISNTTAHGVKNIFEKKHGAVRRGLWMVLVLTSLAFLAYLLYISVADITSYPFRTVTSLNLTSPLPFPAVTICNLNPIDMTRLPSQYMNAFAILAETETGPPSLGNRTGDPTAVANGSDPNAGSLIAVSEVPVEEFFVSCTYASMNNCSSLFRPFQLSYDKCYVLNTNDLPPATRRTNLELTIFVNQAGYMSTRSNLGVKFRVHTPGDTPDMTDVSAHLAATGFRTNVALSVYENQYLPSPYKAFGDGPCTDTETEEFQRSMDADPPLYRGSQGKDYSLDSCLNSRATQVAEEKCKCSTDTGLAPSAKYRTCTTEDMVLCFVPEASRILDETEAGDLLGCPRPCHSFSYRPVISSSYFPSPQYEAPFKRQYNISNDVDVRKNYLELNFYYEEMMIHTSKHVPQYDWSTILGLLGGNMGFFLGASVLTLAELLDFVVCLLMALVQRLCVRSGPRRQRLVGPGKPPMVDNWFKT